ncbi:MAG: FtsX-like permease family protein, partial [Clostridium sp.]|uniref:FtsX-like permease family protein n=1 Tax=Clostridium sp. TaxID=1506 RepID=UPI003EE7AF98
MNFKLALNNVKKSMKNYAIYFLTLSIAVCIFYAFNSVGAQGKLLGTSGDKEIIEAIGSVIGYISVFVSVVLGCLIIYANNFLIKRRKRELGLYMSLGMGKGKISKILVLEEFIIGIISLICGLIGGIILSQFLGLLTIKLFSVGAEKFSLVISVSAIVQTIIYFGIIFILVMIFNATIVSKYKLIDLLTAHKKNEKIKIKSPLISGLIFIISIVMLVVAYKLVIKSGIINIQTLDFKMSIVLGVIGTVLFFYGFTGFIVLVIQRIKGIYYRKLNIFTVKQMNSKINTNFISMAVIC